MEDTQEDLSTLNDHLQDVKDNIQEITSSETEKKISFDEKVKKYKEIIPLLKNESKRKESKLNQINQKISAKTIELTCNFFGKRSTKKVILT